jgi:type I restriction enzyme, R subunit
LPTKTRVPDKARRSAPARKPTIAQALSARLAALQQAPQPAPANILEFIQTGEEAAKQIDLDEAATRQIVDQQLRDRGWDADTTTLRYAAGARPTKGRAMANGRPNTVRPTMPSSSD